MCKASVAIRLLAPLVVASVGLGDTLTRKDGSQIEGRIDGIMFAAEDSPPKGYPREKITSIQLGKDGNDILTLQEGTKLEGKVLAVRLAGAGGTQSLSRKALDGIELNAKGIVAKEEPKAEKEEAPGQGSAKASKGEEVPKQPRIGRMREALELLGDGEVGISFSNGPIEVVSHPTIKWAVLSVNSISEGERIIKADMDKAVRRAIGAWYCKKTWAREFQRSCPRIAQVARWFRYMAIKPKENPAVQEIVRILGEPEAKESDIVRIEGEKASKDGTGIALDWYLYGSLHFGIAEGRVKALRVNLAHLRGAK